MEEPLARVEIERNERGNFQAVLWSETEGDKEFRAESLERLLRDLTAELEYAVGEHTREGRGVEFSVEEEFENMEYADEWNE